MVTNLTTTVPVVDGENVAHDSSPDILLQASRRLDWRFLLPDPDLRQVAYLGPARGPLLESLRLFSDRLRVVKMSKKGYQPAGSYDVVVTIDPSPEALQAAAELVTPGGFLYVEGFGLAWLVQQWRRAGSRLRRNRMPLRYPAGYFPILRPLGFHEVQAYWHWPDFETCTRIIPLDDQGALLYTLATHGPGIAARAAALFGRWLVRSGLLPWLAPCFSIVARRGAA